MAREPGFSAFPLSRTESRRPWSRPGWGKKWSRSSTTTPMGTVLHYAFDMWLARKFPSVPFERYVDDAVVHCRSEKQARMIRAALEERMGQVGLSLHPDK